MYFEKKFYSFKTKQNLIILDDKIELDQYFHRFKLYPHDQLQYAVIVPVIQQKHSIIMMAILNYSFFCIWLLVISILKIQRSIFLQLRKIKILKKYFTNYTKKKISKTAFTIFLSLLSVLVNILSVGYLFQYKPEVNTINTIADLNNCPELDLMVSENLDVSWITSKYVLLQ